MKQSWDTPEPRGHENDLESRAPARDIGAPHTKTGGCDFIKPLLLILYGTLHTLATAITHSTLTAHDQCEDRIGTGPPREGT